MSKNGDYKVHRVFIKEAEFEVLVLEIPANEIEDKLTYLAREKGNISKNFYEDFIIAACVANINQLLYHLNQQGADLPDLLKVREEVVAAIIKYNPLFDPAGLVVNNNYVVKVALPEDKKDKTLRKLTDNKQWDAPFYDDDNLADSGGPSEGRLEPSSTDEIKKSNHKKDIKNKIGDIDKLDYEVVQKWWKRIGQYVAVKKFDAKHAETILKKRFFHNRTSFSTFVVSTCVEDFEELFSLLDNLGIPNRVAPPLLMHELFELCRSVNEFLTFDNAQKLSDKDLHEDGVDDAPSSMKRKRTSSNNMKQYMKKAPKKNFKDLPKKDLLKLADNMKIFLIGQNEAVDGLAEAIQRASVGLKDPNKPIGSFLFAGRTGIGKTLATKVLADELIKDRNNLLTVDCSEYSADHEYSKLIGAPSGYVGHEAGGFLTNHMQKNPFSVIVFDEVEKASKKVHELLLQVMEEGRLTDGKGKTVSFKDAIIIMTSNIGVSEIDAVKKKIGFGDVAKLTEGRKKAALDEAIKKKFKPEFINRMDAIIHFNTLQKEDYMRIIDIELYKLNDNLQTNDTEYKDIKLKFDKRLKNLVYKDGIDEEFGARPLKRCIETSISTPLAVCLLKETAKLVEAVRVTSKKSEVLFEIIRKTEEAPFYLTDGNEKAMAKSAPANEVVFEPDGNLDDDDDCDGNCGDGCDCKG